MGGALEVESEVGSGTRFWFTVSLPVAAEAGERSASPVVATLAERRLLVVDESPIARRIARGILERAGALVSEVESADEGFAKLEAASAEGEAFDAAVVAGPIGFALAERLRGDAGLSGTRVLVLTAAGDPHEPARARAAGIRAYLTKPVAAADLLMAVRAMLGLRGPGQAEERRMVTAETLETRRSASRVLLAEDNPVSQQIAVAILTSRGHQVDVADTGALAIAMCRANRYDLVLMDLEMPDMGGLEASRIIRETEGLGSLPIVALTAHAVPEQRERCREAGMVACLTKPFNAPELLRIVEDWSAGGRASSS
jgi:CheY-like chemotaxis protein